MHALHLDIHKFYGPQFYSPKFYSPKLYDPQFYGTRYVYARHRSVPSYPTSSQQLQWILLQKQEKFTFISQHVFENAGP